CDLELLDLAVHVGRDLRVTDVGVDLDARNFTARHWLERTREVVNICRDNEPPDGDLVAHHFRGQLFALGDEAHRVGDLAPPRVVHLGMYSRFHCRLPTPVLTGSGSEGLSQPRCCLAWRDCNQMARHPCLISIYMTSGLHSS